MEGGLHPQCPRFKCRYDRAVAAVDPSDSGEVDEVLKYLGIPDIYGLDHNHGVTYTQGGTLFPQPINLGATFNPELARRGAEITAYESRAANCPWVFNPVVDLSRDPRWPRVYESFGEDPIVNAKMVVAEIRGYQGDDNNHIDKYLR